MARIAKGGEVMAQAGEAAARNLRAMTVGDWCGYVGAIDNTNTRQSEVR